MTGYTTLRLERPEPGIAVARLDRPERLNAITFEMFEEFVRLQRDVDADDGIRALVITGAGRGFCSGLDLDLAERLPRMTATEMLEGQESWARSIGGFRTMRTPVIAAVNGPAAGAGMALALAADIRVAATTAVFNAAFVRIGLSGGDVGTSWLLPRVVGLGRAYEILLTGRKVDAQEALRIGMVTDVGDPEDVLPRALETARLIRENSPLAMALTKQVVQTNVDAPSLEAALALENRNQVLASRSSDMTEALQAFRQKRRPLFTGR
ncbi:enoyl-CoA hydratase/isomerase family protein [Spirillospora sp. NPDC046719]